MKKSIISILFLFAIGFTCNHLQAQNKQSAKTAEIAETVLKKGLNGMDLGQYPGTLLMHGMSELALIRPNDRMLDKTIGLFLKYKSGEIEGRGSFISYEAGGSGAAYLVYKNKADVLEEQVKTVARKMHENQRRSSEGILTKNWKKDERDRIFIDMAFAVTPYLLYSGLAFDEEEYIDLAVYETLELFRILRDKKTGLVRQARGFRGKGTISEDNWSRGNGWGAFALSILARDLPESHPQRKEVEKLAKSFFKAVLRHQDKNGLWHQEMSDSDSYIETSGSGLLLYGLGILIEKELLPKKYRKNFIDGLKEYALYIGTHGSVSNTCTGCLVPGMGTKQDYIKHPWALNDHHAFGPAVLAFTQAAKMGIDEIKPKERMGKYVEINK